MEQRNYFLIFLVLLVTVTWYQHSTLTKRIDELEDMIDECSTHNFDLLENRIAELDSKINDLDSRIDEHNSRIDDLEIKTMFRD